MRDCSELLKNLKNNHKEVYSFICKKATTQGFFIGIRDNYLNIYYKCASVVRISMSGNKPVFVTHLKYLGKDSKDYITLTFTDMKSTWLKMLKNINYIQLGKSRTNLTQSAHTRIEKICQQWIVNEANSRQDSEWYYVDLEYDMQRAPTGRFDMIAVSKKRVNGRHRVALVELKVKNGSYSGMDGTKRKKHESYFDSILEKKDELYNPKFEAIKFGSGIVGHIADYLRFLQNNYYGTLKQEIVNIIKCHNELNLLNDPNLGCISCVNDLAEKPEVHIISYTKLPNYTSNDDVPIKTLKESMYKYLFDKPKNTVKRTSEYCLERCINGENIDGFTTVLTNELFNQNNNEIHCIQNIKGHNYDFYFTFVDAAKSDAWNCLPNVI